MQAQKTNTLPIPTYMIALLFYAVIIFFVQLSDGIMSYIAPVFIEDKVQNPLIMGAILSSSSIFGIICDALFPNLFRAKRHLFFLWNTIIIASLFPVIFLFFPHIIPSFILAMAIWGVYFEFMLFSNSYFIEAFISIQRHGLAWGVISTFRALSLFIAPLIAPYLLDKGNHHPLIMSIIFLAVGMLGILIFKKLFPHKKRAVINEVVSKRYSFHKELAIWRILFHKLWPLYIFLLSAVVLEASMFSVGVLATEDLRQQSVWGGSLLAAHVLPNIFTGLMVQKLGSQLGKKKLAFYAGGIGGVLFFVATQMPTPMLMVLTVFVASCFTSITYPAIMAVMQDYVSRLGSFGSEMVGLQNAAGSMAYIIGPTLAGGLSLFFGNVPTIGMIGLLFGLVSLLNVLIVPRKIKMPQKALIGLPIE